ncbi:MAG: 2Fe-2S iron-sulfur cluster binding domain-containing protein [Rhodobacter sp.]|nr:2Fe-2S iron-sulfur cluster binding domain-containing protein [Paracoccaceae bacterium]MCC0077095.1 2Fe-2S iron-sulfur cluster binding domain-containing protein [Rhodobacter sp.]
MVTITLTLRDGTCRTIDAAEGYSLMEAIRAAGIDEVEAACGGSCSCATCHVYVDAAAPGSLPPLSDDEDALLDFTDTRQENSRLSCQITLRPEHAGLAVTIAPPDAG